MPLFMKVSDMNEEIQSFFAFGFVPFLIFFVYLLTIELSIIC